MYKMNGYYNNNNNNNNIIPCDRLNLSYGLLRVFGCIYTSTSSTNVPSIIRVITSIVRCQTSDTPSAENDTAAIILSLRPQPRRRRRRRRQLFRWNVYAL